MTKKNLVQPFLKWAGGKRQLIPEISKYMPIEYNTYYEPFIGAGAVLFHMQPKKAVINDINEELVNVYDVIKNNVNELIIELQRHELENTKRGRDYFYEVRSEDRRVGYEHTPNIERAARVIYLNKTCYNGLYRVNSKGQFNVPYGDYKKPLIVNEDVIRAVSNYLSLNDVTIMNSDFENVVESAQQGDFVYLDPPYDPVSTTSSFTSYSLNGFGKEEQIRLRDVCINLDQKGCKFLLSNSATDFIKDIFDNFHIEIVSATRNINSVASRRGKIDEVLVMNYGSK